MVGSEAGGEPELVPPPPQEVRQKTKMYKIIIFILTPKKTPQIEGFF